LKKYNFYRYGISETHGSTNNDQERHLNTLNSGDNFVTDTTDSEISYNQEKQKDNSNNYYGGI
jgi:hypothetical protein